MATCLIITGLNSGTIQTKDEKGKPIGDSFDWYTADARELSNEVNFSPFVKFPMSKLAYEKVHEFLKRSGGSSDCFVDAVIAHKETTLPNGSRKPVATIVSAEPFKTIGFETYKNMLSLSQISYFFTDKSALFNNDSVSASSASSSSSTLSKARDALANVDKKTGEVRGDTTSKYS